MSALENLQNTFKKQSFSERFRYSIISRRKWDVGRIPDLNRKVAIVTGANSSTGIGFHIAHQLAIKGAKVYVGARDLTKAMKAVEEMRTLSLATNLNVHLLVMDLGDFKQVQEAADTLLRTEKRLDILVNSAALWDQHGISQSFSINHLGPFLFTTKLLPFIKETAKASPVSSIAPLGVRFRSVEDFSQILGITDDYASKLNRYGLEKLANILFAKELDRHFRDEGINVLAISLRAGTAKTDGALTFVGKDVSILNEALTPFEGALTPLFAAADPVIWEQRDQYGGTYLVALRTIGEPSENAQSAELARELWKASEVVLKRALSS
ncbi:short-chain dehydrogenase [Mycena floridula]|nr:short-chain dehydrogenase [Mycena floridula]